MQFNLQYYHKLFIFTDTTKKINYKIILCLAFIIDRGTRGVYNNIV